IVLAGGFLVGQALSRSAATIQTDAATLRTVGLERRSMAGAALRGHMLVAGVAAVTAIVVAVVASRWFPVGFAAGIDPDRGFHADWLVLGIGVFATVAFVVIVVAATAFRAVQAKPPRRSRRATTFVDGVARRTPVSVGVGTAMVMQRGRARVNVPITQAIVGAVIGVVGVVGTLTINANLRDAVNNPQRAGVTFDVTVMPGDEAGEDTTYAPVEAAIAASDDIDASAEMVRELIPVEGIGVPTFTVDAADSSTGPPIAFTLLDGRAPDRGEAVIGPKTARDLGNIGIGDTIRIGEKARPVHIVGLGLFPQDVHSEYDEGLWVTRAQLDDAQEPNEQYGRVPAIAIRLHDGVDPVEFANRMGATVGDEFIVAPGETPTELANLRYVRTLPIVLAVFLGLLALAALLHVLMTVARTRRSEFAVLRALGMTRRATRAVINVQGTTVAVIGLVVGVPVGVLLGREIWHLIAASVPIEEVSTYEWLALLAVVVVALVAANLAALWPGRRAARLHPAEVLRSE
ncbi:MAG TPA: FtsX-like permease family protein, partial [Acidimicrobiia bacterium]|nr:FtsX-like permease family protein [Acidimicrobiia bacterium]